MLGESSRKSGARCLCGSNSIILLLGCLLWIMTTVLFLIGGASEKIICQPLEDPQGTTCDNLEMHHFQLLQLLMES